MLVAQCYVVAFHTGGAAVHLKVGHHPVAALGPGGFVSAGFPGSLAPAGSDHGPAGHRELCSAGAIAFRDAGEAQGLVGPDMFHVLFAVQV